MPIDDRLNAAQLTLVVSRSEFAGHWEYLLDAAIYTVPAHGSYGGAALIDGGGVSQDDLWSCTTCRHCMESCPMKIEHVDKIVGLRRNLVLEDSRFPQELTAAFGSPRYTRIDAEATPDRIRAAAQQAGLEPPYKGRGDRRP